MLSRLEHDSWHSNHRATNSREIAFISHDFLNGSCLFAAKLRRFLQICKIITKKLYLCTHRTISLSIMMKRILFMALVCIVTAMAQAQSLDGEWKSEQVEKNGEYDIFLKFSGSNLDLKIMGTIEESEASIVLSVTLPCDYVRKGNKLDLTPHTKDAKIKLEDLKVKGELADSLEAHPEYMDYIKFMFVGILEDKKDDLLKEFPIKDVGLEITSQTDSTLTIRDDKGEDLVFTRVKEE